MLNRSAAVASGLVAEGVDFGVGGFGVRSEAHGSGLLRGLEPPGFKAEKFLVLNFLSSKRCGGFMFEAEGSKEGPGVGGWCGWGGHIISKVSPQRL